MDETKRKLLNLYRKPVRAKPRMEHSSLHARLFTGQVGRLMGVYQEDNSLLVAMSFPKDVAWVDYRDLEV